LRISKQKLVDQRFLFLGAGSAATGIAELISQAMVLEGLPIKEARQSSWLLDGKGLVVKSRTDLQDFQRPFSHDHSAIASFVEAIETIKPTCIIGVSTVPKLFNQQVIEAMSRVNERPIIFPYSNPTSRSECSAEEAYRWSNGKAIFASGSPFGPVQFGGKTFVPGQGNNVYIFPALGMAILATQAKLVTEAMFIVAAKAVAEQVTPEQLETGLIYPHQSQIFEASIHVAVKVAERIFEDNLAGVSRPADLEKHIRDWTYHPVYPPID
jgi:malate dehydrogenase (oxaloacetate-decarboxylating)(NADP+)